jgi:hypothetical protein
MIEVSIRKFYVTEDGTEVVPLASFLRAPTAEEFVGVEAAFDSLADELGAVDMTDEEIAEYLKCEQQEVVDSNTPDSSTVVLRERA